VKKEQFSVKSAHITHFEAFTALLYCFHSRYSVKTATYVSNWKWFEYLNKLMGIKPTVQCEKDD
jgi:hypothetical protein